MIYTPMQCSGGGFVFTLPLPKSCQCGGSAVSDFLQLGSPAPFFQPKDCIKIVRYGIFEYATKSIIRNGAGTFKIAVTGVSPYSTGTTTFFASCELGKWYNEEHFFSWPFASGVNPAASKIYLRADFMWFGVADFQIGEVEDGILQVGAIPMIMVAHNLPLIT